MATLRERDTQLGNWLVEHGLQSQKRNERIERRKKGRRGLKGEMDELIEKRPKYEIAPEAYTNQAIAKARAFGRDRTIQRAEENVDQDVATGIGQTKNISSSTGAILDTLGALSSSGMESKRALAGTESQLQNQRIADLYGTNSAMIDEKDKQFGYNVNDPYQLQIQKLREQRKYRQELLMQSLDLAGTVAGATLTGGATAV